LTDCNTRSVKLLNALKFSLSLSLSLPFNDNFFSGGLGLAGFIEAKDDGSRGTNWSCKTCKIPSQIIVTNKPTSNVLQDGCPSCHPTNSVRALTGKRERRLQRVNTACSLFCRDCCNGIVSNLLPYSRFLTSFYVFPSLSVCSCQSEYNKATIISKSCSI